MLLFVYALLVMGLWPETINHLYCIVLKTETNDFDFNSIKCYRNYFSYVS